MAIHARASQHAHARGLIGSGTGKQTESGQAPKAPPMCTVAAVGRQPRVTANNGNQRQVSGHVLVTPLANPTARSTFATSQSRHVLATPLANTTARPTFATTQRPSTRFSQQSPISQGQQPGCVSIPPLNRVLLKAVLKGGSSKDGKTFTVRIVDTATIYSCDDLKITIREQLCEDIIAEDFELGFVDGSNVVRIHNKDDFLEVWSRLRKPGR